MIVTYDVHHKYDDKCYDDDHKYYHDDHKYHDDDHKYYHNDHKYHDHDHEYYHDDHKYYDDRLTRHIHNGGSRMGRKRDIWTDSWRKVEQPYKTLYNHYTTIIKPF